MIVISGPMGRFLFFKLFFSSYYINKVTYLTAWKVSSTKVCKSIVFLQKNKYFKKK